VSPSEDSATSSRRPSSSGGSSSQRSAASPAGSAAAAAAQEQLVRMQEAWRESVEKDVSCLREVLAQYKEQAERLEMQKKLLLSQVGDRKLCWDCRLWSVSSSPSAAQQAWQKLSQLSARCCRDCWLAKRPVLVLISSTNSSSQGS
jgi:hypothetical protein